MGFDSSANLLFKISADAAEAQANVQGFRSVLSKELGGMKSEFSDWSQGIFGVGAAVASAVVAASAFVLDATQKWMNYALEIGKASKLTGISTENMSRLAQAAEITGVPLDALTRGLGILYSHIVKANEGSKEQIATFRAMGISAKELAEAEKDPYSFLLRLSDAYHENASAVQQAARGREEFGRGIAEILPLLSRGRAAIQEMGDSINGTSKIVTSQAVIAAKEYKESLRVMKEEWEKIVFVIGKTAIPILAEVSASLLGLAGAMKTAVTSPLAAWSGGLEKFYREWVAGAVKATLEMRRMVTTGTDDVKKFVPTEIKEAAKTTKEEFYGLSSIIETLRGRMAGLAGDETKIYQEAQHIRFELQKAEDELFERAAAGKLTPAVFERELAALRALPKMIGEFTDAEILALTQRRDEMVLASTEELETRMVGLREQTFQNQRVAAEREIALLIWKYKREENDTKTNLELIERIRAGMLAGIDREQLAAFSDTMNRLQAEYAATIASRLTSYGRIASAYDQDVARYSKAEEEKSLLTAKGERTRAQIRERYDLNRQAALDRYGEDLMRLQNSQGWQGVFGDFFAQRIRGNEELLRDWQTSADQSMLMTRVAVEALGDQSRRAFGMMAQGMGQAIAQAIIYKKSVGEAMREALAQALASIAAECMVMAIYSTALGFIRLAQHQYVAAGQAFMAAGYFGAGAAAALVVGRAVAPKQGAAGAAGGAGEGVSGGGSAAGASEAQETRGPRVQIIINGHVIGRQGIDEIAEMINDAVRDRDVPLLASGVKNNTRLLR